MTDYGISKELAIPFDQAVARVTDRLKEEGFGVLTSIDLKETLKKKLNIDFKRYTILGACNPQFAHRALMAEEEIGLLLPCNVAIVENDGGTVVSAFNPQMMSRMSGNSTVGAVADEVEIKIRKVISGL